MFLYKIKHRRKLIVSENRYYYHGFGTATNVQANLTTKV